MPSDIGINELGEFAYHSSSLQVIINTETMAETSDLLSKRLFAIKNQRISGDTEELALVIGEWHDYVANDRWKKSDVCAGEGMCRHLFGIGHHVQGEF